MGAAGKAVPSSRETLPQNKTGRCTVSSCRSTPGPSPPGSGNRKTARVDNTWVWASLIAQLVKNLPEMQETPVRSLGRKILWRRNRLPTPVFLGFLCDSPGKESAHNAGDLGSIPGLGRFPWRRERLPTLVFWPEEFHGLYSPRGRKELDTTERLSLHFTSIIQSNKVFFLVEYQLRHGYRFIM